MTYNKTIILGNLTRDTELRYTPNNNAVCSGGIATNSGWGENKRAMFIDFTVWGKRGEAFDQAFSKGDPTLLEGELRLEQWEDKNTGAKRSKHVLNVDNWQFVASKKDGPAARPYPEPSEETTRQILEADDTPF